VSGYCIHFDILPCQHKIPKEIPFEKEHWQIVDLEIKNLLSKKAIKNSVHENKEFISTIFIVPKPNGKFRPVINLKYLNAFVHYDHFKQETFKVVLDILQKNDFLTSIDLQDAYFSVPIHKDFQKFLKFQWNNELYQFVCLPFGLKSAPFVFTKILKPVFAWLRHRNIRCSYYIDDSIIMNQNRLVCKEDTKVTQNTLEELGFLVNLNKSVMEPVQRLIFFGFIIDTVEFKIFLTEEKINKILQKSKILINKKFVIVRDLASFIGSIINAFYAVLEAPLHYRQLERNKLLGLGETMNFDNKVLLNKDSINELQWWQNNLIKKNGKLIRQGVVNFVCRTDASLLGWGAVDLITSSHANGRWDLNESLYPINYLELLAIFYGLQSFYNGENGVHIQVQSDNVAAVSYINDMGGIASLSMDRLSGDIWQWCLLRDIFLSAIYIPGSSNTADYYSRNFSENTEWTIKSDIFQRVCKQLFYPNIDLFASRLNKQIDRFVSWYPEPGSFHNDAFSLNWREFEPYIFPPFNLIAKVLNKLKEDRVEKALLIFPYWTAQSWFPVLLDCLIDIPVSLPRHKDLLFLPHSGELHPLGKRLKIFAAIISSRRCQQERFHQQLQSSLRHPGLKELESSINMRGRIGCFGTVSGLTIPFRRLK